MHISFDNPIIHLSGGTVYYENTKILKLQDGTYDSWYMMQLFDQCKHISKTLPVNVVCVGLKKIGDDYDLVVIKL